MYKGEFDDSAKKTRIDVGSVRVPSGVSSTGRVPNGLSFVNYLDL